MINLSGSCRFCSDYGLCRSLCCILISRHADAGCCGLHSEHIPAPRAARELRATLRPIMSWRLSMPLPEQRYSAIVGQEDCCEEGRHCSRLTTCFGKYHSPELINLDAQCKISQSNKTRKLKFTLQTTENGRICINKIDGSLFHLRVLKHFKEIEQYVEIMDTAPV